MPNNRGQKPKAMRDSHMLEAWQSAFFDRLLDRVDPRGPSINAEVQHAQVYCGRWLALQRLQLGLTTEELARQVGIDPQSIFLLESGLADPQLLSDKTIIRLRSVLNRRRDATLFANVIALALGQLPHPNPNIVEQVMGELEEAYNENSVDQGADEPKNTYVKQRTPQEKDGITPLPPLSDDVFSILGVLAHGEQHVYGILRIINENSRLKDLRISVAGVSSAIKKMQSDGLVRLSDRRPDPALGDKVRRYYELTHQGREAFEAEYKRRDNRDSFKTAFSPI